MSSQEMSGKQEGRVNELNEIGFSRLGKTSLFINGDAIVDTDRNGLLSIMVDYDNLMRDWNSVKGFQVGGGEFDGVSIVTVNMENSVMERTINGSGGGYWGKNKEQIIARVGGRSIEQQLIDSGFKRGDLSGEVFRMEIPEEDGGGDLIAVVENGRIKRVVKPTNADLRELMGENFRIKGIATKPSEFRGEETVLTIENDTMVFDVSTKYGGNLVRGSQRLLRSLDSQELGIVPFPETREGSGFVVGGVNDSKLILSLESMVGQSIYELETRMRPNRDSMAGFLGENESLLKVLAEDNDFVRGLGLTHQKIAAPLMYAREHVYKGFGNEFTYHGVQYRIDLVTYRGMQFSPFEDETGTASDMTITNLGTGDKLNCSALLPDMIERYGFYEGKKTPYRLEPSDVIRVFGLDSK